MARSRIVGAAATTLVLPLLSVVMASPALATSAATAAVPAAVPAAGLPPCLRDRRSDTRELTRKDFTLDGQSDQTRHAEYQPQARNGAKSRGRRGHPAGRHRPAMARPRRLRRPALPQGLHAARRRQAHRGVGRQRPGVPGR